MIVGSDRQDFLGMLLPHHVLIELLKNAPWSDVKKAVDVALFFHQAPQLSITNRVTLADRRRHVRHQRHLFLSSISVSSRPGRIGPHAGGDAPAGSRRLRRMVQRRSPRWPR